MPTIDLSWLAPAQRQAYVIGVGAGRLWILGRHRLLCGDSTVAIIMDMKQPGVTVQPLRQMNGYASFNQVLMTDAKMGPEFRLV